VYLALSPKLIYINVSVVKLVAKLVKYRGRDCSHITANISN